MVGLVGIACPACPERSRRERSRREPTTSPLSGGFLAVRWHSQRGRASHRPYKSSLLPDEPPCLVILGMETGVLDDLAGRVVVVVEEGTMESILILALAAVIVPIIVGLLIRLELKLDKRVATQR